ncbi:hypothetical protein [Lyngbya sp. CCY1209]|uniref:hypothetical protein n=1 Tax=Lyngbya sp. CCY1209 TaxID=2886103 RepID=UPI002D213DE9|nr:hypothetical protein [Lyngbya sp. CCY1209]MEB3885507.1 hypothetical protein [Lyngbya sp. CCY1209]
MKPSNIWVVWNKILQKLAEQDGISTDQFVTLAIAEKISALTAESYLRKRARRSDRSKYEAVRAKIPDTNRSDRRDRHQRNHCSWQPKTRVRSEPNANSDHIRLMTSNAKTRLPPYRRLAAGVCQLVGQ